MSFEDQLNAVMPGWTEPGRILLEVNLFPDISAAERARNSFADAVPGTDLSTPDGVAAANGDITQVFGSILAVAPASTLDLNTDSSLFGLPLTKLALARPMQFLLGSLTIDQMTLLASTGLGMSDLNGEQQTWFAEIIPDPLLVVPSAVVEPTYTGGNVTASAGALGQQKVIYNQSTTTVPRPFALSNVRLHAYLRETFSVLDPNTGRIFSSSALPLPNYSSGPSKLTYTDVEHGITPNPDAPLFSRLLISKVPNIPKPSDLTDQIVNLRMPVSIAAVQDVDDLIAALARATKLELYADSRYGKDPVFIGGDHAAQPGAGDLLSALALCVHGTWRQVGTAYVLTDDKIGLSTRQHFVGDVLRCWSNRLDDAGVSSSAHLVDLDWLHVLPTLSGDTLDLTRDQLLTKDQLFSTVGTDGNGAFHWKDLPANQQALLVKQIKDQDALLNPSALFPNSLSPNDPVNLSVDLQTTLALPGTGEMSFVNYEFPTRVSVAAAAPNASQRVTLTEPMRGIICAPKNIAEAQKVVDLLPSLGFNTIVINVFHNGRAFFPNSGIAPENDSDAGILAAALAEAKAKNITLYAAVDMFCWRKDALSSTELPWPGATAEDVNIFGEPSEIGVQRRLQLNILPKNDILQADAILAGPANEGWVSPLDVTVETKIPKLLHDLATVDGLSGIMACDTAPPGYTGTDQMDSGDFSDINLGLGFSDSIRLAYLRNKHSDPIDSVDGSENYADLPNSTWSSTLFNTSIPGFEQSLAVDRDSWSNYLLHADLNLLTSCFNAVKSANSHIKLYMRERLTGATIDPWMVPESVDQVSVSPAVDDGTRQNYDSSFLVVTVLNLSEEAGSLPDLVNSLRKLIAPEKAGGLLFDYLTGGVKNDLLTELVKLRQEIDAGQ